MKAHFYLEGTNEGASFLESYVGQEVDLISPRKEISPAPTETRLTVYRRRLVY